MRIAAAGPALAGLRAGGGTGSWRAVEASPPAEARLQQRWQRLWLERRRGRGGSLAEAEAALRQDSTRALLLALDGAADAVVVNAAESAAVWRLLEPAPAQVCADLWLGRLGGDLGWLDWQGGEDLSAAAERLRSASAAAARACGATALPVVVDFAGGRDPLRARIERWAETLRARTAAIYLQLYSPLLFSGTGLQVAALLQAVRKASGTAVPVMCIPQLPRSEFAAALTAAGGTWCGPFRAGAELPVACLSAEANPGQARATAAWLECLARCG